MRKQKKIYRNYKINGFKDDDKLKLDNIKDECFQAINTSKENYLKSLGLKLIDKTTGQKTYWKILNGFLNKCKNPRIPSLLAGSEIIVKCYNKAKLFNSYFLLQCKLLLNNSVLPHFNLLTNSTLESVLINNKIILDIVDNINVNKAFGPDNISGQMIKLCGENIALPLSIIFNNIINTGIFPNI